MKIELIKSEKRDGTTLYHLEADGEYIPGSYTGDRNKANENFEVIMKGGTLEDKVTVLKTGTLCE